MKTHPLELAESRLLAPTGLDASTLARASEARLGPGIDFGDLDFQHARREAWSMEDGIVKDGSHSIEQGVGVRAISGEKTGFAYSDALDAPALMASAQSARAIARDGRNHGAQALQRTNGHALYPAPVSYTHLDVYKRQVSATLINSTNPAAIPPLALDVAELRFGGTPLGSARFRSSPIAGGLRVDEFRTSGGKQRLAATGSWLGKGDAARTQFRLDADSDDVGALLAGFGLGCLLYTSRCV